MAGALTVTSPDVRRTAVREWHRNDVVLLRLRHGITHCTWAHLEARSLFLHPEKQAPEEGE